MKPTRRHIRLTYVASGESVLAELLEDEAPGVCEYIWGKLPIETKAIHGMYSGLEVFTMIDRPEPVPGEILYFFDPSVGAVGAKKPVGEVVLVYGRGVVLRAHEGVPTHCALFARIPGDWKYDWVNFAKECRKARWEGPQVLRIERA